MKKMLSFERKTAFAIIAGGLLIAVSAPNRAQETATAPLLAQALGKDQIEETVRISLGLTEQPAGETHVDYLYSSAEITLPEIYKPQRYELQGYTRMKPGRRVKVEGQGILLAQAYLAEAVSRPTAVAGFLTVWQGIMRDIGRADPDSQLTNRTLQMPGPVGNEEIAAAEKRLGMQLPTFYRETMQRSGPWRVSLSNGFSFEMLAPPQLVSVSDWHRNGVGEESAENQVLRQQFKQDIVFAVVNDAVWVLRRSEKVCGDGQLSFAVGQTARSGFYVSETDVCGAGQQLEAIRRQMLEALNRALSPPEFTVVGDDQRLHFERNKSSESNKVLPLYLKADI